MLVIISLVIIHFSRRVRSVALQPFSSFGDIPFIGQLLFSKSLCNLIGNYFVNANVEGRILNIQGAVQNVDDGQTAGNIEETVKVPLPDDPLLGENAPEVFESSKEALNEDSSCAELRVFLAAHNDTGNVSSRANISQVRKNTALAIEISDVVDVRSEDSHVVDGSRERS